MNRTNIFGIKRKSSGGKLRIRATAAAPAGAVQVRVEELVIPTYLPAPPDKNPMFLEKRVYQGSSGKVYPLPFTDRIAEKPVDRKWKAVWIENEFIRAMVLPEIGGRIHAIAGQDQRLRFHLQPARSSSPRSSAWPARGFPAASNSTGRSIIVPRHFCRWILKSRNTPTAQKRSGAATMIPMCRMKGMHGVCLHPGKSFLGTQSARLQSHAVHADISLVGQCRHARA